MDNKWEIIHAFGNAGAAYLSEIGTAAALASGEIAKSPLPSQVLESVAGFSFPPIVHNLVALHVLAKIVIRIKNAIQPMMTPARKRARVEEEGELPERPVQRTRLTPPDSPLEEETTTPTSPQEAVPATEEVPATVPRVATQRAYASHLRSWTDFAARRALPQVPTSHEHGVELVIRYIRSKFRAGLSPNSIRAHLSAINGHFAENGIQNITNDPRVRQAFRDCVAATATPAVQVVE